MAKGLSNDPADRFESMEVLLDELEVAATFSRRAAELEHSHPTRAIVAAHSAFTVVTYASTAEK